MSLRDEIKQTRPFESTGHEATVALLRTASSVKRSFEALCKQYGVTLQQYNVLRILRGAGSPLPTMEVADRMVEYEPGVTRLVDRIVAKGLVEKSICKEDARRHLCELTDEGSQLLDKMAPVLKALNNKVTSGLSEEDAEKLVVLLADVRSTLASI
ncbi:MAG: winged helix-turn-helix transcriptional regulator [Rhodothermales bacterium]|nr:winged helix-turn-helix transcriptional regulator [Rhodothermales bacterium]